jgi:hypothetical protein
VLPARATFTYEAMPAVTAAALREKADRIRKLDGDALRTVIEAGRELLDAKQKLQGRFVEWVAAECGFSVKTAENYMNAAMRGGPFVTVTNAGLVSLGVVYRLTTKCAPPELVQDVLDRATKGEFVPNEVVVAALDEARRQKREAERKLKASNRRAQSKKVRERLDREHLQQEERRQKEEERIRVVALSIIETLGEENTFFLIKNLGKYDGYSILDRVRTEFLKNHQDVRTRAALDIGVSA